jgi:hypothetical protein
MQKLRDLTVATAISLLFVLHVATPADAGFGDAMKKKGCEVSCASAEDKCIEECSSEADKGACKLACEEAEEKCIPECVES